MDKNTTKGQILDGGCLVKGDNFGIRVVDKKQKEQITGPYVRMGEVFAENNGFDCEEAKKFTGPEKFSLPMRLMLQFVFKTMAKKRYNAAAAEWGCTEPLDARPWK